MAQRAQARDGLAVLGRVSQPPPPAKGSGERCKLPQWGLGRSPGHLIVFCVINLGDGFSCYISELILDADSRPHRVYTTEILAEAFDTIELNRMLHFNQSSVVLVWDAWLCSKQGQTLLSILLFPFSIQKSTCLCGVPQDSVHSPLLRITTLHYADFVTFIIASIHDFSSLFIRLSSDLNSRITNRQNTLEHLFLDYLFIYYRTS